MDDFGRWLRPIGFFFRNWVPSLQKSKEWLSELHLSHYTTQLLHWCQAPLDLITASQDNGASTMEEVWFSWEDFSEKLDVKPLERKRIVPSQQCKGARPYARGH